MTVSEIGTGRQDSADAEDSDDGVQRMLDSTARSRSSPSTLPGEEGMQTITAQFTGTTATADVFATDNDDSCDAPAADHR